MTPIDIDQIKHDFFALVNMSPARIEHWLDDPHSKEVGWSASGKGESVGHKSGRRIVAIKRKPRAELTTSDYAHMRKVVGYIKRHTAQRPHKDITDTRWRYSLMNWGHDPMKRGHSRSHRSASVRISRNR